MAVVKDGMRSIDLPLYGCQVVGWEVEFHVAGDAEVALPPVEVGHTTII